MPGIAYYCGSKFALEGVSDALGKEVASLGIAGVSLDRWYRFCWKWLLVFCLIGGAFVVAGVAINYGPF